MTSQRVLACTGGVLCSIAVLASSASAQTPPAPQKPGPEHEQLKYFVGKWTTEGETKPNPFMPAGKFTSSDDCELFSGGFYVVCHTTGKGPAGPSRELGILGYDPMKKVFTYYGISNRMAVADSAEGKHEGESWVYTSMMEDPSGKKMQGRFTMTNVTPNSYNAKYEMAPEGSSDWTLLMEAKATRAAAPTKSSANSMKKDSDAARKTGDAAKDVAKKAEETARKP